MSDREILSNAIDKAIANGYGFLFSLRELIFKPAFDGKLPQDVIYAIIFSHSFAKAFWGEPVVYKTAFEDGEEIGNGTQVAWQYHLQQMVLEENPIKYLEKFL